MSEKTNPYDWIDRDGRKRLFQEFKLLSDSRWRDRIRVKQCRVGEYQGNLTIEAEISGAEKFFIVQVVFPGNYPEVVPKVFIDPSVMSGNEGFMQQQRANSRFFNSDGSIRLHLPAKSSISAVMVLDRVDEWLSRYKRHEKLNNLEV